MAVWVGILETCRCELIDCVGLGEAAFLSDSLPVQLATTRPVTSAVNTTSAIPIAVIFQGFQPFSGMSFLLLSLSLDDRRRSLPAAAEVVGVGLRSLPRRCSWPTAPIHRRRHGGDPMGVATDDLALQPRPFFCAAMSSRVSGVVVPLVVCASKSASTILRLPGESFW
jgi:hypothetical protein